MKSYGAAEAPSLDGSFDFGLFDGRGTAFDAADELGVEAVQELTISRPHGLWLDLPTSGFTAPSRMTRNRKVRERRPPNHSLADDSWGDRSDRELCGLI